MYSHLIKKAGLLTNLLLYLVLITLCLFPDLIWTQVLLIGLFIASRTLRKRTSIQTKSLLYYGQVVLEFILIFWLLYPKTTEWVNLVFMIFVFELILNEPLPFSVPFTYLGYVTYLMIWRGSELEFHQYFLEIINYSFYIVALLTTKVLLVQKQKILELNERILIQSQLIEETSALKERNRIAEEMHDTLGHTLTASIVSLEGVSLLMVKNPEEALALLTKSKILLKESLSDIRETVRNLKDPTETSGQTLKQSMDHLISDIESRSHLQIIFTYALQQTLAPLYDYVLYNTLREALTNILRHSQANRVTIDLAEHNDFILLTVSDDGNTETAIHFGFGLNTMNSRIKALGGTLSLTHNDARGITLTAQLPMAYDLEDSYGKYENSVGG